MSNTERPTPGLRPLLSLEASLPGITSIGTTPTGEIRLIPISGGTFEGEELRGEILGGGADWQDVRNDGVLEISARYILKTDQGEMLEVRSVGLRAAPREVLERLGRGERVPSTSYYFRTAVRFRTAAARLERFNNILAVSYGERRGAGVHLDVYEVL
ncbi:MAG TPA: DUF3237 family protein [Polyangiales bacterium]|nr:DUF3237 family protein [Polyangiales bacterium]